MTKIKDGIRAVSVTGYDRRYEDHHFDASVKAIELYDHEGVMAASFEVAGPNALGVRYSNATSFYRAFANTTFEAPIIFDIGELAVEHYKPNGDAIPDGRTVNMAQAFKDSDLSILPHGGSRELISNINEIFSGCKKLRHWLPQEMVAAGLAMVKDPEAPRIIRSNGIAESAFLFHLKPETMRYAFKGCIAYDGHALNAIDWRRLKDERSAEGWAEGCRFEMAYLNGIIANLHREAVIQKRVRKLSGVNLGHGRLVGLAATQYHELREHGIEVIVEQP